MGLPDAMALVLLASLVLYAVLAGADFGGGVWDLFAHGPRAAEQRACVERALAPVWEANHVWLVLAIVVLFTAFPPAFSAILTALHVPLTLLLVGVVLRGSAFVFRQYGEGGARAAWRWGRIFAIASTVSPVFLGIVLGALAVGRFPVEDGLPTGAFLWSWARPFPIAVGLLALSLFAFLAAVYLTTETDDRALQDDFRARAWVAAIATAALAVVAAITGAGPASRFAARLLGSWWSAPLLGATALAMAGACAALARRSFRLARGLAIAVAVGLVGGWGAARHPFLLAPDVTIEGAAAPRATLLLLAPALVGGAVVLAPSLYWLLRVFKGRPAP